MTGIQSRGLGFVVALSALVAACGGVRETAQLHYPGDGRSLTGPLSAAIARRGYSPQCMLEAYCRFKYDLKGDIHFKLKPTGAVLAIDVKGADEMMPADLDRLLDHMGRLGQEIWYEAVSSTLARHPTPAGVSHATSGSLSHAGAQSAQGGGPQDQARAADQAARFEAERRALLQVSEEVTTEPSPRGAAFKIVTPERAVCRIEGDSAWSSPRQIEIPFQIPATRDVYYTFDCEVAPGAVWHKKLQAKDGAVTVVRLHRGGVPGSPAGGPPPPPPGPTGR